jgi:hypothetical protein
MPHFMDAGKRLKLTFDFGDQPDLVETLRRVALHGRTSQKSIVVEALSAYFANRQKHSALLDAANQTFADWDNEDDKVYDSL